MGKSVELCTAEIKTPSISYAEDRGRPKVHCLPAQVIAAPLKLAGAITLISATRRHSPFPGA